MFQRRVSPINKKRPSGSEISEARFKKFVKDFAVYERKLTYTKTMDSFLDLYSAWKRTHKEALKLRLVMMAFELHRLDKHFTCDLSFQEDTTCGKSKSDG